MVSQYNASYKDSPPARYRTSNFPMFPYQQLEGASLRGNTTIQSVNSSMKIEDVDDVPRAHEGHRLLHAQQPIIIETISNLTSDVIDNGSMELLEKRKLEKMMIDIGRSKGSVDKYRGKIPQLVKVRQNSLPPVSKRQQSHKQTRQTAMTAVDKRKKPKTADNLSATKYGIKNDHVQVRDTDMVNSKPRFQSGPYAAKPFKLLPPIASKMGEKKSTKEQVHDGEPQKTRKPAIAVRHTKKSAQIESRAKAKLDAEKAAIQEALTKVKQPLARIAINLASKTQSTASGFTASDWSTTCIASSSSPPNESSVSIPHIPQLGHTFNTARAKSVDKNADDQAFGRASVNVPVESLVDTMKEELSAEKSPRNGGYSSSSRVSSSSNSSKVSQSVEIRRSRRDFRPRSLSVSSPRSDRSVEKSTCIPESKRSSSSRVPPPRTPSQNSLAVRSVPSCSPSLYDVKKSARLSTPGSCKHTNVDDDRKRSKESSPSIYSETVRSVSRRSRREERSTSPSPHGSMKSSRCSQPGSSRSKMKVKSDKSGPNALEHSDYKSDSSPLSTVRSSTRSSRPPSVSSNSASTSRSVSERSRNSSRMKSAAASRGSSCASKMSNKEPASPTKRDRSRESSPSKYSEAVRSVSRRSRREERSTSPSPRGSIKSSRCSQPGSARSKMKVKSDKSGPNALEHSDYKSDRSPLSTARSSTHSSQPPSVSSNSASTSRSVLERSRNVSRIKSKTSYRSEVGVVSDRKEVNAKSVRSATSCKSLCSIRPGTALDRPKTASLCRPMAPLILPDIAPARHSATSDRPTNAPSRHSVVSARHSNASVRPNTAPVHHSTASISHTTTTVHESSLSERSLKRSKASPVNPSPRSSTRSITPVQSNRSSSRNSAGRSNRS